MKLQLKNLTSGFTLKSGTWTQFTLYTATNSITITSSEPGSDAITVPAASNRTFNAQGQIMHSNVTFSAGDGTLYIGTA